MNQKGESTERQKKVYGLQGRYKKQEIVSEERLMGKGMESEGEGREGRRHPYDSGETNSCHGEAARFMCDMLYSRAIVRRVTQSSRRVNSPAQVR